MRSSIVTIVGAVALLASLSASVQAMTAPRVSSGDASIVTPVRDGCGWHRHYSRRLGHCVHD